MAATLAENMQVYEDLRENLEAKHFGKWVLIHDQVLVGVYDDFQKVAEDAVKRFDRGPYHIRQVGAPDITPMPASLIYRPI